jgi:rhodanese-related sulfurtransferase
LKLNYLKYELAQLQNLDKNGVSNLGINGASDKVLCFCRSGARSGSAQSHLTGLGFQAINVEGGIMGFSSYVNSGDL